MSFLSPYSCSLPKENRSWRLDLFCNNIMSENGDIPALGQFCVKKGPLVPFGAILTVAYAASSDVDKSHQGALPRATHEAAQLRRGFLSLSASMTSLEWGFSPAPEARKHKEAQTSSPRLREAFAFFPRLATLYRNSKSESQGKPTTCADGLDAEAGKHYGRGISGFSREESWWRGEARVWRQDQRCAFLRAWESPHAETCSPRRSLWQRNGVLSSSQVCATLPRSSRSKWAFSNKQSRL